MWLQTAFSEKVAHYYAYSVYSAYPVHTIHLHNLHSLYVCMRIWWVLCTIVMLCGRGRRESTSHGKTFTDITITKKVRANSIGTRRPD